MGRRLNDRLQQLRAEHEKGKRALAEVDSDRAALEAERTRLTEQLLRISGAITVLEELSADGGDGGDGGDEGDDG